MVSLDHPQREFELLWRGIGFDQCHGPGQARAQGGPGDFAKAHGLRCVEKLEEPEGGEPEGIGDCRPDETGDEVFLQGSEPACRIPMIANLRRFAPGKDLMPQGFSQCRNLFQ